MANPITRQPIPIKDPVARGITPKSFPVDPSRSTGGAKAIKDSPVSEQSRTVEDINAWRASQNLGRVGDSKTAPQPAPTGGQRRAPAKAAPATPATPATPAPDVTAGQGMNEATHKPRNPALARRGSAQAQSRRSPKARRNHPGSRSSSTWNNRTGQNTPHTGGPGTVQHTSVPANPATPATNVSHVHPGRKYHMPKHDSYMKEPKP